MNISKWGLWSILTLGGYSSRKPRSIQDIGDLPAGYKEYFIKEIEPLSAKFEKKRQHTLMLLGLRLWTVVAICLVSLYLLNSSIEGIFYIKILLFFAVIICLINISKKYKQALYTEVLSKILAFYGDFTFSFSSPVAANEYQNSQIIPAYDREYSKNFISGNYKGLHIEQFYTRLIRKIDQKNQVQVFAGLILKIKIKKQFKGATVLKKDHGVLFNWMNHAGGLDRVVLEDPEFENIFEVFASDQIEARYLLTTAFMERLLKFRAAMDTKSLTVSFFDQHMLVLIARNKPVFSNISLGEPADFTTDSSLLLPELQALLQTIDILKLDQDIGL